jgi:hypothetical protein
MTFPAAATDTDRPTEAELLEVVAQHRDGIDALSLAHIFTAKGYEAYNVQRVMQRALDRGALELGPQLKFVLARAAA